MIVDLFAGPGGWEEGARMLGITDVIGVEWDESACRTAEAAGHLRVRADVAALDPLDFVTGAAVCDLLGIPIVTAIVEGLIASPPCQAWSLAGKRGGEEDRAACHQLVDRMAAGDDSTDWREWTDPRSPLVCQPVRWARILRPEWIALEEVPAVLGLWEHMARIFRGWGYSVWVGLLMAADFGVPQTRTRAILMASRTRSVHPPEATHEENPQGVDLFGGGHRRRWVSMAEALGWSGVVGFPRRYDGVGEATEDGYRERDLRSTDEPAQVVTNKARSWSRFVSAGVGWGYADRPAPTVCAGANGKTSGADWGSAAVRESMQEAIGTPAWVEKRPATTVAGTPRIADPGHKDRAGGERQFSRDCIRVTVEEAGVLQSFPPDYPWQGSRTKQYEQVGNAIPPLLAAAVLSGITERTKS